MNAFSASKLDGSDAENFRIFFSFIALERKTSKFLAQMLN
jgi:hypothetical protein